MRPARRDIWEQWEGGCGRGITVSHVEEEEEEEEEKMEEDEGKRIETR